MTLNYNRRVSAIFAIVLLSFLARPGLSAAQTGGGDAIEGKVTSPHGAEAGVWVIAETTDLPTKFAKIVVTDDDGRYVIPELPKATYNVWVRGYGLVDSPKKQATSGKSLDLTAVIAPDARAAAYYYPAGYWYSLLRVPGQEEFPGTGSTGNGISPAIKNQAQYLRLIKSGGCMSCHNLGSIGTRTLPDAFKDLGSSEKSWERRLMSGQAGGNMISTLVQVGRERTLKMFADWTDRIAGGEVPAAPKRPEGVERNVVITQWDWADPKAYLHDLVSTDRRNPTINANGLIYGSLELSADYLPVLDPIKHTASRVPLTVRDPATKPTSAAIAAPSPYWGDEPIWTGKANVHNAMFDQRGRVWITATVRPPENPPEFKKGSAHPSAELFPLNNSGRQLGMYDPKTGKYTHVSTGFGTHHVMFAEDADNTAWTSGGGPVVGWLNTRKFDETGDEVASQGWTALILDTNGNGRRDDYVEPNEPVNPAKDKRIGASFYAVSPAPDGSVWGSSLGYPGSIIRLNPGANPPATALAEYYELPVNEKGEPIEGFSPRGMDIDRNGVVWVALASGHLASFDRSKVKAPLNGPKATGQHAREGWTFYAEPLPQMQGVTTPGSAEASYYTWVDQFDTFGLGKNVPINTGNESEGLLALKDGKWVVLRVPYPLGFYTKWMDGRIDDPAAGWKGRGLWACISTRAPFHMEGGKGNTSKVMKFQLRPNPLAR
jgi:streptogramin lyase